MLLDDAMLVRWNPDGIRHAVNSRYLDYYGLSEERCVGTTLYDLVVPEDRDSLGKVVSEVGARRTVVVDQHRTRLRDGRVRWQLWLDQGVFDARGELTEIYSLGHDITDTCEHVVGTRTTAPALNAAASGIAHDLNNLLMVAQGQVDMNEAQLDRRSFMSLHEVFASAAELVTRLSALDRFTSWDVLDVGALVTESVDRFGQIVPDIEVSLYAPEPAGALLVRADSMQIRQVVFNALFNAYAARKVASRVAVSVLPEDRFVRIVIHDSGTGMSDGSLARVFEPSFSSSPSRSGLGAGLMRSIVERHGGLMTVESRLDVFTKVTVRLPLIGSH